MRNLRSTVSVSQRQGCLAPNAAPVSYRRQQEAPDSLCFVLGLCVGAPATRLAGLLPQVLPLAEDGGRPLFDLRALDLLGDPGELAQIGFALLAPLVLEHLQQQLHLVDVVHEQALRRLAVLVLLPDVPDVLAVQPAVELAEQVGADVVHGLGFAAALLFLSDGVDGGDVADQRLGHVVDQGHAAAPQDVQLGAHRLGRQHGEDAHAVHVVGDALAVVDAEAAPARALGGLEAL